jgi:hypothetical protein
MITPKEKAQLLMDEALRIPGGISAELAPDEILSVRSSCYAIRNNDRLYHDGKSKYGVLTFSVEYPGPRLFIRRKPGASMREGDTNAPATSTGT